LHHNFRNFDPRSTRVVLFDGGRASCRRSAPRLAAKTRRDLERLGIEVHLDTVVTTIDDRGVEVRFGDGSTRRFAARTKIWAAG